jgi:hypothetical protein
MGKPENLDDYVPIQVGEWARRYGTVYVPREMWGRLRPASWEFNFYIEDRGRFRLEFDRPIGRLKV